MLPRQLAVGAYYQTGRWAVGVDYVFQNWGGRNSGYEMTGTSGSGENKTEYKVAYTNTSTIKMGVEYTPNRYDARHFLKRWSYRAGFRYGAYNQTFNGDKLVQYAVTAGIGLKELCEKFRAAPSRPSTSASSTVAAVTTSPTAWGWSGSSISSLRSASRSSRDRWRTANIGSCAPSSINVTGKQK